MSSGNQKMFWVIALWCFVNKALCCVTRLNRCCLLALSYNLADMFQLKDPIKYQNKGREGKCRGYSRLLPGCLLGHWGCVNSDSLVHSKTRPRKVSCRSIKEWSRIDFRLVESSISQRNRLKLGVLGNPQKGEEEWKEARTPDRILSSKRRQTKRQKYYISRVQSKG